MIDCCENCRHYQYPEYCVLMDEIVNKQDNCGMFNGDEK